MVVAGGCGSTQVYRDGVPAWLMDAAGGGSGLGALPYVIAHPTVAGGFLFSFPLQAGHPRGNKVLWAVRTPREDGPLEILAHPLNSPTPVVRETRPADSGPGEIYPDGLDVPSAGCWEVSLSWPTAKAQIELNYIPAA